MEINCSHSAIMDLHKIVPNPKNANKHPEEQILRLAKIIDFQGQRSPIIISKRSGFVVKGHGRLEAIKKLGWEKAAVDFQEYDNEAQEYADMIADNEISKWAEFDVLKFKQDFPDFNITDLDLFGIENFSLEEGEELTLEDLVSKDEFENFKDHQKDDDGSVKIIKLALDEEDYAEVKKMMEITEQSDMKDLIFFLIEEFKKDVDGSN